ncbi:FAD-dependent oxidoreductase [Arthrobacter sp. MMS24-S77]
MSDRNPSTEVLVVGGGMAGLAGALALRANGAEVTLVERAPEFGEVGAGLQMAPNASRVLKRWGLLEKALEIGVRPKHLVFRDALTGEELTRQTLGGEFEERYGAPYVVIHRSDLHRILLEACQDAGVRLVNDVVVEKVETVNARGMAHTASGDVYEADVVIGADGLKSTLRAAVAQDCPVSSSYVAYRGTVPITADTPSADLEDVIVYLGPDCHLVQYPLRKGELLNTVAVFKSRSFERGEEQYGGVDELEAAYKDCVPAVQAALRNLGTGIRWPMYDRDPIENWIDGRLVLMGDAAHPMLQYLAQGACQALEDAAVLQDSTVGSVFTNDDGVDAAAWDRAISEFNSARAARTARVQRTARIWGESWHVSGVARVLRNLLFKSRKDGDFQYNDWLYGQAGDGVPEVRAEAAAGASINTDMDVRVRPEERKGSLAGTHA